MACHVTKINNNDKQSSKQKLIMLVNMNLKAFETVNCTCTILSISNKSRFTWAEIWSVCVITRSPFVAFVRVCFAFINICRKFAKTSISLQLFVLSGSLVGHFNCAIISEFSLQFLYWVINIHMNCSYVNQTTCAILSISSISKLTIAYMWSNRVGAVCILMTKVVSLALINVYEIADQKKDGISKLCKKLLRIRHYCPKECKSWLFSTFCCENKLSMQKNHHLKTFSWVTVSLSLKK